MSDASPRGIWPPHEVFYLESLLFCTAAALDAADVVREALDAGADRSPSSREWQECALSIVNGVQTLVTQAGAVSRYFWPARDREPHRSRAAKLRAGLGVGDHSPLQNRELRNHLEHFDERLDEFCAQFVAGVILPTYVGPLNESEVPIHLFRAYYTDIGVFELLGNRYEVQPVLDAIRELHNRLRTCIDGGSRLPDTPAP